MLRELNETPGEQVVGFVDDDPRLWGRRLQGVRVAGGIDDLERILARREPDAVLVTIPDAPRERLDAVVARAPRGRIVPVRAPRDRPRPGRRPGSDGRVNGRSAAAARRPRPPPSSGRRGTDVARPRARGRAARHGLLLGLPDLRVPGLGAQDAVALLGRDRVTQISRAIAATGHPAIRGEPHAFDTLYTYLIAPVWWIHSTAHGLRVVKYIGVLVMTAVDLPDVRARADARPAPARWSRRRSRRRRRRSPTRR